MPLVLALSAALLSFQQVMRVDSDRVPAEQRILSAMKTDKQIYSIFAANPQWVFELTGLESPGPCKLIPVTLKAIEQSSDGVIFPESLESDLFVLEFQFQFDREIYTRVTIEMALIQQKEDYRPVQGIILFLHADLNPQTKPWCDVVHSF